MRQGGLGEERQGGPGQRDKEDNERMQSQGQSRESRIVEQRRTEKLAAVSIRNRNRQTKRPRSGGWRRRRRRRSAYWNSLDPSPECFHDYRVIA